MSKIPSLHPINRAWLLDGPLSLHVPAYISHLKRGRYAATSAGRRLAAVAHFAHWMSMSHIPVHVLDDGCVDFFLRVHLPCCDCPQSALRASEDPVMFPPGRARLATSPAATGSPPTAMTMGIVVVAALRTRVPGPLVTRTSGWRPMSSAARAGSRSYCPSAHRYSMTIFRPSA